MSRIPPLSLDDAPHSIPSGILLVRDKGKEHFHRQGNVRSCAIELTSEEIEERDRQSGLRGIQKKYQIDRGGTLTVGLLQSTEFGRRAALMAEGDDLLDAQAAGNQLNMPYATAIVGGTYFCGQVVAGRFERRRMVSNVSVTDTGAVNYQNGVDFVVNPATGAVTLLKKPAGAGAGLVITFDCAPLATQPVYRIWSATEVEVEAMIVQDNLVGDSYEFTFPRVEFKKTGEYSLIVENSELMVNELEGTLYVDGSQPAGFELGYATPIAA